MKRAISLAAALFLLAASAPALAKPNAVPAPATWYVNAATGSDSNAGNKIGKPLKTIGMAVSKAGNGDTVRVAAGQYVEQVAVAGFDSLTLQGGWDAAFTILDPVANPTVILGDGTAGAIGIDCRDAVNTTIYGFSIQDFAGSGISMLTIDPSVPAGKISRCSIRNCNIGINLGRYASTYGEKFARCAVEGCDISGGSIGIAAYALNDLAVTGNRISGAAYAGIAYEGTYNYSYPMIIANNLLVNNGSYHLMLARCTSKILNNTLVNAGEGITIYRDSVSTISNNIIAGATMFGLHVGATSGGGGTPNLFFNNAADSVYPTQPTDILADPLLDSEFRLTAGSPAIDGGADQSAFLERDIDGDPRSVAAGGDGLFDIGADEFTP